MDKTLLSQVICTRISHDLIGNAGALSNALELLEDGDTDFLDDIKKILAGSSAVLSARMRFFRLAFGLDNAALFDNKGVFGVIKNYLHTLGNMTNKYDFQAENTRPEHNRYILLTVMIFADLLIKGGEIRACFENDDLWIAGVSQTDFPRDKIAAVKSILHGDKDYETDAQYAHILCLKELIAAKSQINLLESAENTLVFQICGI